VPSVSVTSLVRNDFLKPLADQEDIAEFLLIEMNYNISVVITPSAKDADKITDILSLKS
jgi:hypothetical protein